MDFSTVYLFAPFLSFHGTDNSMDFLKANEWISSLKSPFITSLQLDYFNSTETYSPLFYVSSLKERREKHQTSFKTI